MKYRCLGVDCGEHAGFGVLDTPRERVHSEVYHCRNTRFDSTGMKFLLFEQRLNHFLVTYKPDIVAYEVWNAHKGLQAAQALAGYLGILTKVLEHHRIPGIGLNVQEIKKFATGNPRACKDTMLRAANILWGSVMSHDEADALHIARRGLSVVYHDPRT